MEDESPGRRAAAYWFSDGLPDIVFGLTIAVVSIVALIWQILAPHPLIFDFIVTTVAFALYYWKERAVLDFLKSRTTYPRTGYVQPPDESEATAGLTTLSITTPNPSKDNVTRFSRRTVMVVFWLFYMVYGSKQPVAWLAPAVLAGIALFLYIGNRGSEHPYPALWALILALSGVVLMLAHSPTRLQPQLCGIVAGVWLTGFGLFTFFRYRQANP